MSLHCAEQTWSLTRRAFLWAAQMSCSARVPECQAHQHDCQAYQECYSARPTSSALLLVLLCQAQPAVVLLVIHSQAPPNHPNHPTAGSTLSALSPRDTERAGRPDDGWSLPLLLNDDRGLLVPTRVCLLFSPYLHSCRPAL